ncbi:cytochrome ubiquinol oxidase subunit I [Dyella humicola]|uniref:cytochrome ubiquinol oxidase subunit I n=1 Tax=Dyella humicola TaxID=2992126 RepID=UPI00225196E8|nr:cytochrome ubiquinol oxidase subunit I [Dyella humicola]
MLPFTALELARIQFGFTVAFHIIFPAITIGLASYLAVLEGVWLWKKQDIYKDLYLFWSKIFAVNFAMGVVSGLVMAYEFGTNWSRYSSFAGSVTGPLLAYEVLTAFFLEAGFLGVMLFGWKRVGRNLHFFSSIMVAIGTLLSATWILASNSWMQTPQGYSIVDGVVVPVDWVAVIFNPSFPYRLAHMCMAAMIATALFVGASGAWHILKGDRRPAIKKMFSMAMWMLLFAAPIQILIGDAHGLNTLKHQPAKIAAIEGHWDNIANGKGVPLLLFGLPNMGEERTDYGVGVPHLGSLILTHTWSGTIQGLKEFPREDRPNAAILFWSFRVMVGLGVLTVFLAMLGAYTRWRGTMYESRILAHFTLLMGPAGLIAMLAGWFTTEIGRQPWVVYGLMRTKDAVSNHSVLTLSVALLVLMVMYTVVFGTGITYMFKLVQQGPREHDVAEGDSLNQRPSRPLSAAVGPSNSAERKQ